MSNTQNNDRSTSSSAMAMEEEDEQQVPRSSTTSNKGKHGNMINIIDDGYTADVSSISDGDSTLMNKDQQQQGDSKLGLVIDILQPARKKPRNDDLQSFCRNNSSSLYRSPFPTYRVSRNSNSRHRSRGRHHRRHRRRRPSSKIHEGRFQQQRPAPSPIHPDIDISLTHHIMTGDLLCPTTDVAIQDAVMPLSNSNSSNGPTPAEAASTTGGDTTSTSVGPVVPALTEAVLQYFRDWKRDTTVNSGLRDTGSEQPQQQQQQVLQQEQQQLETARVSSDTVETMVPETKGHRNTTTTNNNNGNRKRRHRLDDGSSPPSSPPVAGASKNDNANVKHQMQEAAQAQVISDVASFSNRHYKLEDALELTDTPRLLLESNSPYRVIHVNAAFSRDIVVPAGSSRRRRRRRRNTSECVQDWMERQNDLLATTDRSLQEAIENIIPDNVSVPLTCYPVMIGGRLTHYLIEASTRTAQQQEQQQASAAPGNNNDNNNTRHRNAINNNRNIREETMEMYKPFEAVG